MKKIIVTCCIFLLFIGEIFAQESAKIIRGPYLQSGTPTSCIVRWKTESETFSTVWWGTSADSLVFKKTTEIPTTEHEIKIDSLQSSSIYFYAVGTPMGDTTQYFLTSPEENSTEKLRFIVYGDCGTGTPEQKKVLSQTVQYFKDQPTNGLLLLGDNAYYYGREDEYQSKFFDVYQSDLLKNTVLWPALGNHDYSGVHFWEDGKLPPYYNLFSVPTHAEAGGEPSETRAYYSFNVGNTHFIALDSFGEEERGKQFIDSTSKQYQWLIRDLENNKSRWKIAFFHHPPFSKGSHDSDAESDLVAIREKVVPIFYKYGVDLVLTGHSHNYERSAILNNFVGKSEEYELKEDSTTHQKCPFSKTEEGTVFVVAGSAGWTGKKSKGYPHRVMQYSNSEQTGALILEIEDQQLHAKWLSEDGDILDNFSIYKRTETQKEYQIECGDTLKLSASWQAEKYRWNNSNETTKTIFVQPTTSTNYVVSDTLGCFIDSISVKVLQYAFPEITSNSPLREGETLELKGKFDGKGILLWTGPQGFTSDKTEATLVSVLPQQAGVYKLEANRGNCYSFAEHLVEIEAILDKETANETIFSVYPNPAKNTFWAEFTIQHTQKYTLLLMDTKGRIVQTIFKEKELQNANYKEVVDVSSVAAGVYVLRLEGANDTRIFREIVVK